MIGHALQVIRNVVFGYCHDLRLRAVFFEVRFAAVFLVVLRLFFAVERLAVFFLGGTFLPSLRASERPMAIACLRLVTFLPDLPLFKVPALRLRRARPTFAEALREYFRAMILSPAKEKQYRHAAIVPGCDHGHKANEKVRSGEPDRTQCLPS